VICFCRVGVTQPSVEVRFEDLSVNADVYVGSRALPSLINFTRNIVEVRDFVYRITFSLCNLSKGVISWKNPNVSGNLISDP